MKKIILYSICVLMSASLFGQSKKIQNLTNFDKHKFHFGFVLGYNYADFYLDTRPNRFAVDSLMNLNVKGTSGFNLGIISSWNVTPTLSFRFLPSLCFQERNFDYTYFKLPDTTVQWRKTVESAFLDFPLVMKMRTERIGNFAAYALFGGRFGIDMASNKDVQNTSSSLRDQIVKIQKTDYGLELGGGFDFFLQYFKFGIELKLGVGMKNIILQDNSHFISPIDALRSKVWTLSFTFEG
jgi:hypothetical protein